MHLASLRTRIHRACLSLIGILVFSNLAVSQIVGFFPPADSISIWGSCVPPALTCHIIDTQSGTDTLDIYPTWGDPMFAGDRSCERITHCFFVIRDTLNQNVYELSLRRLSPYPDNPQKVNFDSSFYMMGSFTLSLHVFNGSTRLDSAQTKFYADATGAVQPSGALLPTTTQLLQNFPNPFNPSTTIRYELSHTSRVTLKVYNMLGQQVASLVDRVMPAGFHTAQLSLYGMASGIYLSRFQADELIETSKMVLLQ
jgi:hypothetical protein